jgi:UDP-N-acetylmuramate dehydrogenase
LCRAENTAQVLDAAVFACAQNLPLLTIGEGSNVVLPAALDACVLQVVDRTVKVLSEDARHSVLRIGAGKPWHELVLESLREQRFGLENLALIPGSVGAAPVQNIGAYGRELSEFVIGVHGVDLQQQQARHLSTTECGFAYRDSVFKQGLRDRFVITAVDLRLYRQPRTNISYPALRDRLPGPAPTPQEICAAVIALRQERLPDPASHPNAGSFFKNPLVEATQADALAGRYPDLPRHHQSDGRSKLSAAWLIDHCGLRGTACGQVRVSERHALVLETRAGATQADVLALAERVIETVAEEFGVTLEPEPRIYV